jgi:HSP20 family molecular chaperone IbpA
MAAATKRQPPALAGSGEPAAAVDPKFEWAEKAGGYVLRLALPGFRKDQFRVQVDGAGRLTVRGARPGTGTGTAAGQSSFSKVFQLPSSASLDDITGRFEAGVLTLTVPMRASSSAGAGAPPTSIEELKRKQPGATKDTKPKEEDVAKEDASNKKAMDEATNKAHQQPKQEEEASKSKQEQQKPDPSPAVKKESQELKPKAPQAAPASPPEKPAPAPVKKEEEMKPKVPQATAASPPEKPAPTPDAATGANKPKAVVAPESLAERVRRRSEEEGRNAATNASAKRAKTDGENKATAACVGWKERVQGELKVLTDMKWADGMVEAARNNKEVVALGIAAFSLGLVVSHRLFFRK